MDTDYDSAQKKQLIVIFPEGVAGRIDLARRVHWMAVQGSCDVLYLGFVDLPENMLARSRSMVTMQAMTADPDRNVDWEMVRTSQWLTRLKEILRPGDTIVCHEEQRIIDDSSNVVPLEDFLQETLHTPVRTVSGYYKPKSIQIWQWVHSLVFWIGILAILAGFAFLEIRIHLAIQGIERKVLLILTMLLAVAVVYAWNSLSTLWSTDPR